MIGAENLRYHLNQYNAETNLNLVPSPLPFPLPSPYFFPHFQRVACSYNEVSLLNDYTKCISGNPLFFPQVIHAIIAFVLAMAHVSV